MNKVFSKQAVCKCGACIDNTDSVFARYKNSSNSMDSFDDLLLFEDELDALSRVEIYPVLRTRTGRFRVGPKRLNRNRALQLIKRPEEGVGGVFLKGKISSVRTFIRRNNMDVTNAEHHGPGLTHAHAVNRKTRQRYPSHVWFGTRLPKGDFADWFV